VARIVGSGIALALAAVWLAGCGARSGASLSASEASDDMTGSVPAAKSSRVSIASAKPVDAYVMLGGRIKTCWFNPDHPLLPNHVYRADVSPDGSKVEITIHERRNLGRAGRTTYDIEFHQEGKYTVVTTQNLSMTPEMAAKMQYDINRWKSGDTNCSNNMPKTAQGAGH
jgi:hypothetical protein